MTTTAIRKGAKKALRVLVLGGGDIGSAVAQRLFLLGMEVAIAELAGSAHARRGMAFIDALFDGCAELDGVRATLQPDLAGIQACWQVRDAIPIVTLEERSLLSALEFNVVVDATMRRESTVDLRALAPLAIGVGPGYVPGRNCHIAIETQWGPMMGQALHDAPAAARAGGPPPLGGIGRERFATAPCAGDWRTQSVIGQRVQAGEIVGSIAGQPVRAPLSGILRGVAHDGTHAHAGHRVVEVDPRDSARVHGLGERPLAVAQGVIAVIERSGHAP